MAGETCLWEVGPESRIELHAVTRNIFDVVGNPSLVRLPRPLPLLARLAQARLVEALAA